MKLPISSATDAARQSSSGINPDSWVDQHGDFLYRYALLRVRHPEVAEDLVQETLFAAVRKHTNFRGSSSERSWLCGILKNKICDHFRKLAHEVSFTDLEFLKDEMSHKFIDQGWNHDLGPAEWKPNPEATLDRKEFWETFRSCLDKLPERVAALSQRLPDTHQVLRQDGAPNDEQVRVVPLPVSVPTPLREARSDDVRVQIAHAYRC